MVNKGNAQPGVYSATYSGIPVYEFQFGDDLKEHVMRRRQDDWINATHILKAAGFDKPARTRILEREVQKEKHEKIQGGYGKYQGTWIPLDKGVALAQRNNIYDRLRLIFEYTPGEQSPPPAPRHTSKPKAPKKPAVPKWPATNFQQQQQQAPQQSQAPANQMQGAPPPEEYEVGDSMMNDDDTPDNLTVASASYMGEDDRYDMSHQSGHRKRKREEAIQDLTQQQHSVYGDELLDYFLLSRNEKPAYRPEPPPNFQPNWIIDSEEHTALHWASAMGDVDQLIDAQDEQGNTALHLAAERNARKCIRALLGRQASTSIPNNEGVRAEDLIAQLNATKKERGPQRSSSPFAPDSQRHVSFRDAVPERMTTSKKLGLSSFNSEAANTVQSRITPLIIEKFQDLAGSYDEELREKDQAEKEARRILSNTQAELAAVHQHMAELEAQLEADDGAAQIISEANRAKHQVMSLITHQNRLHVQQAVDQEINMLNGDANEASYEDRLELARQLQAMLSEQRQSESDYVEALSMVGTGENIDKYRRLLRKCLPPADAENLDENLDNLIEMMEEDRDLPGDGSGLEPMDVGMGGIGIGIGM
ncbi:hypothetical protein CSIM01_01800 [Colletotrichum simmondsii]|uniref:HTH APSES-type domain-containing protein n=1 Tax=Colletotrichum simmondsii TaxID=703756 RepID=A0A135T4F6_9PEZI|nr:hypothetical protein CSIM01_01800 [Colletotrichum simmondsii]